MIVQGKEREAIGFVNFLKALWQPNTKTDTTAKIQREVAEIEQQENPNRISNLEKAILNSGNKNEKEEATSNSGNKNEKKKPSNTTLGKKGNENIASSIQLKKGKADREER